MFLLKIVKQCLRNVIVDLFQSGLNGLNLIFEKGKQRDTRYREKFARPRVNAYRSANNVATGRTVLNLTPLTPFPSANDA